MTESKERIRSNAEERHDGGADIEQAQHQRQTSSAFAFAILGRRLRAAVSGPERFRVDAFARNQLRTPSTLPVVHSSQYRGRAENADALIRIQSEQISIARRDSIHSSTQRGCNHVIIVFVRRHGAMDPCRPDQPREHAIAFHQECRGDLP